MGIYNKYYADKFSDCLNGKCYCDRPCPYVTCMIEDDCLNKATEQSRRDGFTPACKSCNDKIINQYFSNKNKKVK